MCLSNFFFQNVLSNFFSECYQIFFSECGADLQRDGISSDAPSLAQASVSVVHSIPELKVSTDVSFLNIDKAEGFPSREGVINLWTKKLKNGLMTSLCRHEKPFVGII